MGQQPKYSLKNLKLNHKKWPFTSLNNLLWLWNLHFLVQDFADSKEVLVINAGNNVEECQVMPLLMQCRVKITKKQVKTKILLKMVIVLRKKLQMKNKTIIILVRKNNQ